MADDEVEIQLAEALTKISTGGDVNEADEDGMTALHVAAEAGKHEVVLLLLEAKADPTAEDADGAQPLILACQGGHGLCVHALLEAGADPLAECNGNSAIAEAALSGSPRCMALLQRAVDAQDLVGGEVLRAGEEGTAARQQHLIAHAERAPDCGRVRG